MVLAETENQAGQIPFPRPEDVEPLSEAERSSRTAGTAETGTRNGGGRAGIRHTTRIASRRLPAVCINPHRSSAAQIISLGVLYLKNRNGGSFLLKGPPLAFQTSPIDNLIIAFFVA